MTFKNKNLLLSAENQVEKAKNMLLSFGLSENESKVYVYLLERGGEIGGSKIAVGAGLHRQYVYMALPRLVQLGLVEEVAHGKLSKYRANAPQEIEKIAKKRVIEAEDIVRELQKFSKVGHEQDFEVLVGRKAILEYEMNYVRKLKDGEEEYIIGGHTEGFAQLMGDSLSEYLNYKERKGHKVFYIGNRDDIGWARKYSQAQHFVFKYFDKMPHGVTHMDIREGVVLFFSFLNPPLLYIIKSPVVAKNYKDFFLMLWEMAGETS